MTSRYAEIEDELEKATVRRRVQILRESGDKVRLHRLESVIASIPEDEQLDMWLSIGDLLERSAYLRKAYVIYSNLIHQERVNGLLWFRYGNLCKQLDDYDDAEFAFKEATRLSPSFGRAWGNLGRLHDEMGERDAANQAYYSARESEGLNFYPIQRRSTPIDPERERVMSEARTIAEEYPDGDVRFLGEQIALDVKEFFSLIFDYDVDEDEADNFNADEWDGEHVRIFNTCRQHLAILKAKLDLDDDASIATALKDMIDDFIELVRIMKGKDLAATMLSRLSSSCFDRGNFECAITAARRAIDIEPIHVDAWNNLSCAYVKKGMWKEAIDAANHAIHLAPNDGLLYTTLGEALEASGDVDGAVNAYSKALKLNPDEQFAIKYLKRLGY